MGFQTAPMSTAPDEAEDGPEESISRSESGDESESQEEAGEYENSLPSEIATSVLQETEDNATEANILATAATTFERLQRQRAEDEDSLDDGSNLASRPGLERPSSADGSLSTPDDSPSIQVCRIRKT